MARIRTVKPELFRHGRLYAAEREAQLPLRLCFIGLFCVVDRAGRFRWEPCELKLDIAPYDEGLDMARVLDELSRHGFIKRYSVDGRDYGVIPNWKRHQVIGAKEAASRLPAPPWELPGIPVMEKEMEKERDREEEQEGKGKQDDAYCPEPFAGSTHAPGFALPKPFIQLITDQDEAYSVYPSMVEEWKKAYPAADVEQSLRSMCAWLMARPPAQRKPMRLMNSFILHWLEDAQNRGGQPRSWNAAATGYQ